MSNSFHTNEEAFDLGDCPVHNRPFECFSLDSLKLICPSCLMFGPHKGENVCTIEEAGKIARERLNEAARQGLLKVDKTESVLLDIRQTKLTCEESKVRVMREVEETFTKLIKKLKERKNVILKQVEDHFNEQLDEIQTQEQRWIEKQELSVELLKFAKSNNEANLVKNGRHIIQAIECINEPLNFHVAKILNTVDLNLKTIEKKKDLNPDEFNRILETYGQKGDIVNVNYRC